MDDEIKEVSSEGVDSADVVETDSVEAPLESDIAAIEESMVLESDEISIDEAETSELDNDIADEALLNDEEINSDTDDEMELDSDDVSAELNDESTEGELGYFENEEMVEEALSDFKNDKWENLSIDEQKEAIANFADFNSDTLGLNRIPTVEYYSNNDKTDFGGYSANDNTVRINEANLSDPEEAVDTIAHEFRHAYQQEHAEKPSDEVDHLYRDNLNNYIDPEKDFEGYLDQIVESDAREYAQHFKDTIKR